MYGMKNTVAAQLHGIMNGGNANNGNNGSNQAFSFTVTPPRTTSGMGDQSLDSIQQQREQDDDYLLAMSIQRATSAPPVMELTSNTLFASQSRYSHLFGDMRCDPNYELFYYSHHNQSKLPPPLEKDSMFYNWGSNDQERVVGYGNQVRYKYGSCGRMHCINNRQQ